MKLGILIIIFAVVLNCYSQEENVYRITELAENLYKLTADGGGYDVKVLAFIGDDGILLVETGKKENAEDLKAVLETLQQGEPVYIINSHEHTEHTGGNYIFNKKAIIIGHENLRTTLTSGAHLFSEYPDELLPELTFSEPITLYFNGEEIKLIPVIDSHTNNDVMVWFTKSKVAYVGAVSNGLHFPSIDETGDVMKYKVNVQKLLDILPDDTLIIPGHGADGTMADLKTFQKMLIDTEKLVKDALESGKDLETMQEEDLLKGYESFESYTDKSIWIQYLVEGFEEKAAPKKHIFEELYECMKKDGIEAAIDKYHELKELNSSEYQFDEFDLYKIAYRLDDAGKHRDAIRLFEEQIEEYPENDYYWYFHYYIGSIYEKLNEINKAREYYNKTLVINPENSYATKALEKLDTQDME